MICNVIDNRKRPFRWKAVNVVTEPTWHDNNCADADQAERTENASDYEERKNLSLSGAIDWAHALPYAVTLYLYDEGDGPA